MNLCSRFQLKKCSRRGCVPEDRISSLPDDILLLVLSFLTFKEMAMMSILSRLWLKLWVHNPVLNFSDGEKVNKMECRNYVNWVNSVLQLHEGHYLKEFRIFSHLDKHNQKDIDSWLEYALARNVENLELNFLFSRRFAQNLYDNYVFPERLLNLSHEKATEQLIQIVVGAAFLNLTSSSSNHCP